MSAEEASLGKQRFVDAAAESLGASVEEAGRGLFAIRMCRDEEGKGGHSLTDQDLLKMEYFLRSAGKQAALIREKIRGEQ